MVLKEEYIFIFVIIKAYLTINIHTPKELEMISFKELELLIIEDNLGDAILVQEYLNDFLNEPKISISETSTEAQQKLTNETFDAIFLDLTLPDKSGEDLVKEIVSLAHFTPVIVLTGYSNQAFGIKALSWGISDYLVKDELTANQLNKSLTYSIERKRIEKKLLFSNERYEILAKATSDTIWDWNVIKKTVTSNQGITRVFGYTEADIELTEKWWRSKIHPDDYKKVIGTLTENIATATSLLQLEYRFKCADGSYKYVLDRAFLIMDMHKKPVRMIGAMQDITTKKIEEERLRLLESVITNATDGIVITQVVDNNINNSSIVYVNEAFIKLTGYANQEILGKTLQYLNGPKTTDEELLKLKNAFIKGESCTIEIVNYKKNGQEFWANISVAPVADSKGNITHWIAIQRDVSDKRNYLLAIEEQNKKLKEIAWIQSHVVRAPLARIMGLANMLIEQVPIEEIKNDELVESISTSAEELDKIIREIVYKTENVQNQTKL